MNFVSKWSGGLGEVHFLTSVPHGPSLPPLLLEMRMVFGKVEPRVGSACRTGGVRGRSGALGRWVRVCVCVEAEGHGHTWSAPQPSFARHGARVCAGRARGASGPGGNAQRCRREGRLAGVAGSPRCNQGRRVTCV